MAPRRHENHENSPEFRFDSIRFKGHAQFASMAKGNKEKAEKAAVAAKQLRAQKTAEAAKPVATPARAAEEAAPVRRVTGKRSADLKETVDAVKKGKKQDDDVDFEVSWANITKVMEKFNITEKQATEVLLRLVGPNPAGDRFWHSFKRRAKEEPAPASEPVTVKREPLQAEVVETQHVEDSQVADFEVPAPRPKKRRLVTLHECDKPDQCDEDEDEVVEQTESEEGGLGDEEVEHPQDALSDDLADVDGEPFDEEDGIAVEGGNDDDNSPECGGGGAAQQVEVPEQVCQKQPAEPVEPVRPPAPDANAARARRDLQARMHAPPQRLQSRTGSEMQRMLLLGYYSHVACV